MNFKCLFGHKYEVIRGIKQPVSASYSEDPVGNDVYLIKKCSECSKEIGIKIDWLWQEPKPISPDYIRAVYGLDP